MKSRMYHGEAPGDDVVSHILEYTNPAIGNIDACSDRVEVKQAYAEAGSKGHKRNPCQQVKGVESGIDRGHKFNQRYISHKGSRGVWFSARSLSQKR